MSTAEVDQEELRAVMAALGPAARENPGREIAQRDFRAPRRLSSLRRAELLETVAKCLPAIEPGLRTILGASTTLSLADLRETKAEDLASELPEPLCALRFELGGQPAWIGWQNAAAVAAVETVLGCPGEAAGARELSAIERGMVQRILGEAARGLGAALARPVAGYAVATTAEELGSWRDGRGGGDSHRLCANLALVGPGGPSTLHCYLPGLALGAEPGAVAKLAPTPLPGHLDEVEVELVAHLGRSEVPLAQMLALEVGDVIPLEAGDGEGVRVNVEGSVCATAELGRHHGRLAVRLVRVDPQAIVEEP